MTTKEIYSALEMDCTALKQRIYAMRALVQQLYGDIDVQNALLAQLAKQYQELDHFQEFCKSRT
jgi:hypothetical protein